ncbi:major facilitator superfamily domain-containing protein [Apodospora peruviana]|uniref:Major facilitator superfamily domain-containing protein n=1 Tax=Apodospora peruviana TaxID=516989 RepID=A0AAE0IU40_9PEZI|nr:major facilitator superfamily domain-containing protein [Apodospora peruviana]
MAIPQSPIQMNTENNRREDMSPGELEGAETNTNGPSGVPVTDTEAQLHLEELRKEHGATWDGPDDPNNPYNWSPLRKNSIGILYSLGGLTTLMSASMIAAALEDIIRDLHISPSTAQIVFSTYFLGLGFGPFIMAASSEMYGRKMVWVYAQLFYVTWNTLSPVGNSTALMIVGRLMSGIGSSAGNTLTAPVMADMYGEEDRGKSLAVASLLPYLGPALGPILGGVITQFLNWRWVFWIMSILNVVLTLLGLVFIRESYTPALLRRKAAKEAAAAVGISRASICDSSTSSRMSVPEVSNSPESFWQRFSTHLLRPIKLFLHRPIIHLLSFALAVNFGVYSFLLSTFATLFLGPHYNQSKSQASLHYITLSVGATAATQIGARVMDIIYARLAKHYSSEEARPEFRVPYMVPGVILAAVGAFWYGWAAEYKVHWAVVDVGAAVFTMGNFVAAQAITAYQLDEFGDYAASAGAACRMPMYTAGFAFPIFAPKLYDALGYGWGNSVIGLLWIVLGWPIPVVMWVWGRKLRAMRFGGTHWMKE